MKNKRKRAFTLAEVLIVLGIIGVIASLTIPGLVQDVQDAQLKVAWKDSYGILNGAVKRAIMDNGGSFKMICATQNHNCLRDKILTYLNYTKKCDNNQSWGNCWHNGDAYWMDGTKITGWGNPAGAILSNGSLLDIFHDSPNCTLPVGTPVGFYNKCARLRIDVNGFSGPNQVGKDIFGVNITADGLKSWGVQGEGGGNTCNKSNSGWGCSTEYLYK